ncbi:MAG: hypothetical protein ACXVHX_26680 [Solirubrobacteraceae bacterium]
MPWRGPEFPGEFPTLGYQVADWIEANCVIPDRAVAGLPFKLSDEQLNHLLWQFRVWPDATYDVDKPAAPFVYNGSVLVRPQKWGKGPFSAARICAQARGPALFGGWDANGEPVGIPWATPHIQVIAVAEDQTDNIWRALVPMIEFGPLSRDIRDTGLDRINLPNGGLIEAVSNAADTRLGARLTYMEVDEPHLLTSRNGGHRVIDTMRRNISGMGGRWATTGNAYDPSENSVEQTDIETKLPDVFIDYPEPPAGSWSNKEERRKILRVVYKGAPWVDVDRIEAECVRLAAKGEPHQAERFFGNRIVSGSDSAFDLSVVKSLVREFEVPADRWVTLGFDGAKSFDTTGLVGCDVLTGHLFVLGKWARPLDLGDEDGWEVPYNEVDQAVESAFSTWRVWRMNADPPYWRTEIDAWAGRFDDDKVYRWETNRDRPMGHALRSFKADMAPGKMSFEDDDLLIEHLGNAVRRWTKIRVEQDGEIDGLQEFLWTIRKETPKSRKKIDLAMAACLAWEARTLALRDGVLNEPEYGRAAW